MKISAKIVIIRPTALSILSKTLSILCKSEFFFKKYVFSTSEAFGQRL